MAELLARLCTVLLAWVLLVRALTGAVPSSDFYSNGESIDNELVASNTQATLQVGTFNFYGMSYSSVTVNFNGVLVLGSSGTPSQNPVSFPAPNGALVAPFWTTAQFTGATGKVYYRMDQSDALLRDLERDIDFIFEGTSYTRPVTLSNAVVVTWHELQNEVDPTQVNTFQCVLAFGSSSTTYIIFQYADGHMNWAGQSPALVGLNAGDGTSSFVLPTSQTSDVLQVANTGNTGSNGRWLFIAGRNPVIFPGAIVGFTETHHSIPETENANFCVKLLAGNFSDRARIVVNNQNIDTDNEDYTTSGIGAITFDASSPVGSTSCRTLHVLNDTKYEVDEQFSITLSTSPQGPNIPKELVAFLPQKMTVTILDNDGVLVDYSNVDASEEDGIAYLLVKLVMADGRSLCSHNRYKTQRPVQVMYYTFDGTARAGIDYQPENGTLTIPAGRCEGRIPVALLNDGIFEEEEDFFYAIVSNNPNVTVNSTYSSARVIITDSDGPRVVIGFTQKDYTVTEGQTVNICVEMTAGNASQPIEVLVRVDRSFSATSKADNMDDYLHNDTHLIFLPDRPIGQTMCVNLTTVEDNIYEGKEAMQLFISSTSSVTLRPSFTKVNILDTDSVTVTIANDSLVYQEGGISDRRLQVCANMTGEIERTLTIEVTPYQGTATFYNINTRRDGDFSEVIKNIVFAVPPSEHSRRCYPNCVECTAVTVQDDHVMEEEHEAFSLGLSHGDPAVHFVNPIANVTIIDGNDVEVSVVTFSLVNTLMRENATLSPNVCVERKGQTDLDIIIRIAARDLTATNHVDFEVSNKTVTIPASRADSAQACDTITVRLLDDQVVEGNETFTIFLESLMDSSRVNISSQGERNVTIIDDDSVSVKFLHSSYNVSEQQGSVIVCLQMKGLSAIPLTVVLTPIPGSATGGADYNATPLSVSLPPSPSALLDEAYAHPVPSRLHLNAHPSSPICANVSVVNDDVAESQLYKKFSLRVTSTTSSVNVTLPSVATVTIEDDDNVVVEIEMSLSNSVIEGEDAEVCARLLGRADFPVQAILLTVAGSALDDVDYVGGEDTVEFPPMTTAHQCVYIPTMNDSIVEREEEFRVVLRLVDDNPRVLLGRRHSVNISIVDNDVVAVGFNKMEYSVLEGKGIVEVCANMTGLLDAPVTVLFSTETTGSGSGQGNQDYIPISNMPLFTTPSSSFSRRECVNITITNDSVLENTDHFNVELSSPDTTVQLVQRQSVVYILDDDGVRISLENRRVSVSESSASGGLEMCVTLEGRTQKDIQVTLVTQQGSATEGSDYVHLNTTLTFHPAAGPEQRECVTVSLENDNRFEEDEEFVVLLGVQTSAVSIHISRTVVTILDDDVVTLSLAMPTRSVVEGESGVSVCVELTGPTERNVSYTLHALDVEAINGIDYSTSFPPSLVFPPSSSSSQSQCYQVAIGNDSVLENTEHFEIELFHDGVSGRVTINNGHVTVTIIDDDTVAVMFARTEIDVDEDSAERSGTVCVVLEGEISRDVSVIIKSHPGTAGVGDFVEVQRTLMFTPVSAGNQTVCFNVYATADKLVETREEFTLFMTSSDTGVILTNDRAVVAITDNDVVCKKVSTDTSRGYFSWPTTFPGETASVKCENGTATRHCSAEGVWSKPVTTSCYVSIEELFRYLEKTEFSEESLRDLLYGLLQMLLQNSEPTLRHMKTVDSVLGNFAVLVQNGSVEVDTDLFALVLKVVDILTGWPADILMDYSSNVIHSKEKIAAGIFEPEKFSSYAICLNRTAFFATKISISDLFPAQDQRVLFSFGEDIEGKISVFERGAKRKKESSIELPTSLRNSFQGIDEARIFLSFYATGILFPVDQNTDDQENGVNVSAVVAASFVGEQLRNLTDDVLITINLGTSNYSNVTCVSWDFNALDGRGAWIEDGCELLELDEDVALCSCNHLTNFACLVNINDRIGSKNDSLLTEKVKLALDTLSVMGICLSIVGLVLTIVTLVVFNKLRKKDNTVFRMQLCVSMILMLVTVLAGIDRVGSFTICVMASTLIQYFTLTSFLWMAAEASLMFHKLVFVFSQVSTRFLAIVSAVCWLLPLPVVIIPVALDRNYVISESYCFISNPIVFFAAFLGPILAIIMFNFVVFVVVVTIVLRHAFNSKRMKDSSKQAKRKTACRSIFSILGIMSLMGLAWVFGAFTFSGASVAFQFLFVIFNSLQGFFIFLFFVVMAKETQDLWLQACGCKKRKKRVTLSSAIISSSSKSHKVRRVTLDENAERLKEMEEVDNERRKRTNTWDIAYVVPQNQFDIFLSSDIVSQRQEEQETKDGFKEPDVTCDREQLKPQEAPLTSKELPVSPLDLEDCEERRSASPAEASMDSTQENALECLSTADSGILMDKVKNTTPSPTQADPPSCEHIHSVSGGYVSAGSSLETLPQREEECYVKDKKEPIEIAPHLKTRAIPNEYARLHIEKV